jgi:hypothetical protein
VLTYGALWLLTEVVGARQVRSHFIVQFNVGASYREVPLNYPRVEAKIWACEVASYAPFVLVSRSFVWWDEEAARGETALYLWFGRPSRAVPLREWAV